MSVSWRARAHVAISSWMCSRTSFWGKMAAAAGPRRLAAARPGRRAQQPQQPRLTLEQWRQCTALGLGPASDFAEPEVVTPPLLVLAKQPPPAGSPWEYVRLWGLGDLRKRITRLIIHPAFGNAYLPAPSRTRLPSVWNVVARLFRGNVQRRLALVDGVTFFYQVRVPTRWATLLRVAGPDGDYCVTRLPMGSTASVAVAQHLAFAIYITPYMINVR